MTAALTLPLTAVQARREWRWHRDNRVPWFSLSGNLAYYKARPIDAALGVLVALLPEVVGAVVRARQPSPPGPPRRAD